MRGEVLGVERRRRWSDADLSPKFPPALRRVLGVKSLAAVFFARAIRNNGFPDKVVIDKMGRISLGY